MAITACAAYANAWPDTLVFDDREFIAGGQFLGLGLADLLGFFSQSLWEAGANQSALYRPLLMVSFGVEAWVFGDWYAGYHLANIALHVVACLLIFGFSRAVFLAVGYEKDRATLFPLLASLLFAVHPVFTEVVNSVFNGSEIYVTIGIAGGLWYLLTHHREAPVRAWSVLAVAYLWALLYRETAVSLPALAVVVLWFTCSEPWTKRVRICLPVLFLLLPLSVYMGLRAHALGSAAELAQETTPVAAVSVLAELIPDAQAAEQRESGQISGEGSVFERLGLRFEADRLASAVKVWYDGQKMLIWPHPQVVLHGLSVSPLWLASLLQLLLLAVGLFALYRRQPAVLLGLLFFYLAILPASRVVGEGHLPPWLMERMLYLPSVGLCIALAVFLVWLARRTSTKVAVIAVVLGIVVLTPLTWARNADWSDEIRLLEGDFEVRPYNGQLLYALIRAQERAGDRHQAITLCRQNPNLVSKLGKVTTECARMYQAVGRAGEAERHYLLALEINPQDHRTYFHLARLYVQSDRRTEARESFHRAIDLEPLPFLREYMSGIMLMDLYPFDRARLLEAKRHMENALQLQSRFMPARDALGVLEQKL